MITPSRLARRILVSAYYATRSNYTIMGDWNYVVSARMVNDVHADFSNFSWQNLPLFVSQAITFGTVTVGAPYNYPQIFNQNVQEYRDDLYYLTGKHSLKFAPSISTARILVSFSRTSTAPPAPAPPSSARQSMGITYTPAQVAADLFPQGTLNASTWNYTSIANPTQSSINSLCALGTFTQGSGNFNVAIPAQPDRFSGRRMTIRFFPASPSILVCATITISVIFNTGLKLNNGLLTPTSNDNHEFAPRVGFVYDLGGSGKNGNSRGRRNVLCRHRRQPDHRTPRYSTASRRSSNP